MADDDSRDGGGSVFQKYGPFVVVVLLAQVALAYVAVTYFMPGLFQRKPAVENSEGLFDAAPSEAAKHSETAAKSEESTEEEEGELPFVFAPKSLTEITINPAESESKHIVMFSVQLGLTATKTDEKEPEKRNLTEKIKEMPEVTEKLNSYVGLMKSTIVDVMRRRSVADLTDESGLADAADEIRKSINAEIFEKAFKVEIKKAWTTLYLQDKGNKTIVRAKDVIFTDIVIQ
jgi:flagellar basal body-associated protein FliL